MQKKVIKYKFRFGNQKAPLASFSDWSFEYLFFVRFVFF